MIYKKLTTKQKNTLKKYTIRFLKEYNLYHIIKKRCDENTVMDCINSSKNVKEILPYIIMSFEQMTANEFNEIIFKKQLLDKYVNYIYNNAFIIHPNEILKKFINESYNHDFDKLIKEYYNYMITKTLNTNKLIETINIIHKDNIILLELMAYEMETFMLYNIKEKTMNDAYTMLNKWYLYHINFIKNE